MADIVFDECWDGAWDHTGKIIVTDSRYMTLRTLVHAHVRGAAVIGTVKVPKMAKKKRKAPTAAAFATATDATAGDAAGADIPETAAAATKVQQLAALKKIFCFFKIPDSIQDAIEKGFQRRATRKINVADAQEVSRRSK